MKTTTRSPAIAARLAACLLVASFPAYGCGGDDGAAPAAATAVVDTVNGIERLQYPAGSEATLGWTVDTAAVLGDAFAEDAYQFNNVGAEGLARDGSGGLLVLDRQGKRVLRYGPNGDHLATYGREGEGPGELNQPLGLAMGPGDTLWVSDFSTTRLTGYPLAGGDPRMVRFPENSGFPGSGMAAFEKGFVIQFRPLFNFRRGAGGFQIAGGGGSSEERPELPLILHDRADLQPLDTLWTTPEPPSDVVQLEMGNRLMVTMVAREFYPPFLWDAFSDGGLVVSDTAAYVLHFLDAEGTPVRRVERAPAPRAVTEADREAARERVREESSSGMRMAGGGGPDEETRQNMLEQRLEKMTFADVVPKVVRLGVDARDRVWVGVSEDVADEVARIDIYDRTGALLGQLTGLAMPDAFLDDGRVALLRRDELDVQQIVVLEVHEGAGDMAADGA